MLGCKKEPNFVSKQLKEVQEHFIILNTKLTKLLVAQDFSHAEKKDVYLNHYS